MNCIANIAINTLCTMEIILTTKEMPLLTTLSVKNVNGNIMDTQENMNIPTPKLKDHYFPILDQGFIALKDVMGTDEDIEQAARVSYQGGTRKTSETRGLLRYCMSHGHTSIFEQVVLKLHVKAPILVFRQWHRHRTWSYNEESGRYSVLSDACLKTEPDEWRLQSTTNKQGSEAGDLEWPMSYLDAGTNNSYDSARDFLTAQEEEAQREARDTYETRLEFGVSREQARKEVPVSQYSSMYATVDLHNLLHFMRLRCDSHAQLEIRLYANAIAGMVKELFPIAFEGWYDYVFQSSNFSRLDKVMLQIYIDMCQSADYNYGPSIEDLQNHRKDVGMTARELGEFWDKIAVPAEQDFTLDFSREYARTK